MKILLINPATENDILSEVMLSIPYINSAAFFAPHAIVTIASLTDEKHEVTLHDEGMNGSVESLLSKNNFDIIGISLITNQLHRVLDIVKISRKLNPKSTLCVGGIGTASMMSQLKEKVDVIFLGEAEDSWPEFLADYENDNYKELYQKIAKPDLSKLPAPRWDLLKKDIPKYGVVSVQTTRGCPFDCSFCDVIYTYGRTMRCKTVEQVINEIRQIEKLKAKMVMFADDNFIADRKFAKDILKQLVGINNAFSVPLSYITQCDISIAEDDELLELMADANFVEVQIGIESIDENSLRDLNKLQNLKQDIGEAIDKIQSYGIVVMTHVIMGADSDSTSVFEKTSEFLQRHNVTHHFAHPLLAPPGTKLWYQLKREKRIYETHKSMEDKLDIVTNIEPKNMSRINLLNGMADYWDKVHSPEAYTERALGFLHNVKRKPEVKEARLKTMWTMRKRMFRMFKYYFTGVSKEQKTAFLNVIKTTMKDAPYLMPKMMYVHTGYVIDMMRAEKASAISREQAQWELKNGSELKRLPSTAPLSETIREQAKDIFTVAYKHIVKHTLSKESVYSMVLESVIDFVDRFGEELQDFDEIYKNHLDSSCERVIDQSQSSKESEEKVNPDKLPTGFIRVMLDNLDRALRVQSDNWEA